MFKKFLENVLEMSRKFPPLSPRTNFSDVKHQNPLIPPPKKGQTSRSVNVGRRLGSCVIGWKGRIHRGDNFVAPSIITLAWETKRTVLHILGLCVHTLTSHHLSIFVDNYFFYITGGRVLYSLTLKKVLLLEGGNNCNALHYFWVEGVCGASMTHLLLRVLCAWRRLAFGLRLSSGETL